MGEPADTTATHPTINQDGPVALVLTTTDLTHNESFLQPTQPQLVVVTQRRQLSFWQEIEIGLIAAWEVLWQPPDTTQAPVIRPSLGFWVEFKISLLAAWEVFMWMMLYVGTSRQEEMDPSRRD